MKRSDSQITWYEKHRHTEKYLRKQAKSARKYQLSLKVKVLKKLGDKCVRCGFSDARALQVDHINGGGCKDLRSRGRSARYREILGSKKNRHQLLCANCNWIKRSENNESTRKYFDNDDIL